jgi:hypothetical protein
MDISIKKRLLYIFGIILLALIVIFLENFREAYRRDQKYDYSQLKPQDKKHLREAFILKQSLGDQIWPDFSTIKIPVILFNDKYAFLVNDDNPPKQWNTVKNDQFENAGYYRLEIHYSKNFAIHINHKWAGSLAVSDRLNREYYLSVRRDLPPLISQLFPFQYASVSSDHYIVLLLQQVFHAYQATVSYSKFHIAQENYNGKNEYPYRDKQFIDEWNREGYYLWKALHYTVRDSIYYYTQKFLNSRKQRREQAKMKPYLVSFEKNMEWLEGLAKYTEINFYELSAHHKPKSSLVFFHDNPPYWNQDYTTLKKSLGKQYDDERFAISGMAQAEILDKISPGWKKEILQDSVYTEDILSKAIKYNH